MTVADLTSPSERVREAAKAASSALASLSAARLVARHALRELSDARATAPPAAPETPVASSYDEALRRRLATLLRARAEGYSYGAIGAVLGVDREWVKRVIRQGSARFPDVTGDLSSLPATNPDPATEEF